MPESADKNNEPEFLRAWRLAAELRAETGCNANRFDHDLRDAEILFQREPAASKLGRRIDWALLGREEEECA